MRIAIVNRSDLRGGAAVVSSRLAAALRGLGHEVTMLVCEKLGHDPQTVTAAGKVGVMLPFLAERLRIFVANGFDRGTLFKIDTGTDGLPLWRHPVIREADAILLNWTNQGMLSLSGMRKLLAMGKPVLVTMHDMWAFTGICHHAGTCLRYEKECGRCPLMKGKAGEHDLSYKTWKRKKRAYGAAEGNFAFVAVSNWLAVLAHRSSLLGGMRVEVIPNPFDLSDPQATPHTEEIGIEERGAGKKEIRVAFGAARIDDPVKDHLALVEVSRVLRRDYPELAEHVRIVTFGGLKDSHALDGMATPHTHLGVLPATEIGKVYADSDIVLSTSLYETLPGTLVEGQAYGAIPVALDHGGQRDIIDHKITGYLAEWSDDREERAARLAAGIAWAADREIGEEMRLSVERKFAAEVVARRYEELIRSLL